MNIVIGTCYESRDRGRIGRHFCYLICFTLWITGVGCHQTRVVTPYDACINKLRQIDGAKLQWALENNVGTNAVATWSDIQTYLGQGRQVELPHCPEGGSYTLGRLDVPPRCSIMSHNLFFGHVEVVGESGVALADVRVTFREHGAEVCSSQTATNGKAVIIDWQSRTTGMWSDGRAEILVTKDGYIPERRALPMTDWPVRFTLETEKK